MTATDALFKVIAEKTGVETTMTKKSRKLPPKRIPARQKVTPRDGACAGPQAGRLMSNISFAGRYASAEPGDSSVPGDELVSAWG